MEQLTSREQDVYELLFKHSGETISLASIAKGMGMQRQNMNIYIIRLVAKGYIRRGDGETLGEKLIII